MVVLVACAVCVFRDGCRCVERCNHLVRVVVVVLVIIVVVLVVVAASFFNRPSFRSHARFCCLSNQNAPSSYGSGKSSREVGTYHCINESAVLLLVLMLSAFNVVSKQCSVLTSCDARDKYDAPASRIAVSSTKPPFGCHGSQRSSWHLLAYIHTSGV